MERYISRNASVGMVSCVAILAGVWETDSGLINKLIAAVFGDKSDVYIAILTAVFAVFGLPALGSIFDYLSSPFAKLLRRRNDSFPKMEAYGNLAKKNTSLTKNLIREGSIT